MNTLISVKNVTVTLRGVKALDGASMELEAGGHTSLIGPNGSGKSTLLRLLRGEAWPDQRGGGRIIWHTPQGPESSPLAGRSMCALFSPAQQQLYAAQRPGIKAGDLILAGLSDSPLLYSAPTPQAQKKLQDIAAELRIEHLLERPLPALSHGQARMALLAKAVIRNPAVLLLDECAEGLDRSARRALYALLERLAGRATIICASHRPDALPFMRRALQMDKGRLAFAAPLPAESEAAAPPPPQAAVRAGLSAARPGAAEAAPLVEISHADVYVERQAVLRDINWTIRRGEQWLLRGPNGAGKSTLLRLLAGYEYPAAGGGIKRFFNAEEHEPDIIEIRRNIRLVSDMVEAEYDYDLPITEIVLSGFDGSVGTYREYSPEEYREAGRTMRLLDLEKIGGRRLSALSAGQQRRAFLARTLVGRPRMILLDEPFAGLDRQSARALMDVIGRLASGGQTVTFVLASHFDEDAHPAFNRRAAMADGCLRVCTGSHSGSR